MTGVVDHVKPLPNDAGTALKGLDQWQSAPISDGRRGVSLSLLYQGTSKYPQGLAVQRRAGRHCTHDRHRLDELRKLLFPGVGSGERADPHAGVRLLRAFASYFNATAIHNDSSPPFQLRSKAASAREFIEELATKHLTTIRLRTRQHSEQTWEGAVGAMFPGKALPAIPKPEFEPPMKVDVPCEKLTAQWKLGAWHILRRSIKDANGKWHFNDYPYGILACETYAILYALDLQGMHKEAADGLDQWLSLPMQTKIEPGKGGHNPLGFARSPLGPLLRRQRLPNQCRGCSGPRRTHGWHSPHGPGNDHVRPERTLPLDRRLGMAQDAHRSHQGQCRMDPASAAAARRTTFPPGSGSGPRVFSRQIASRPTAAASSCNTTRRRHTTGWPSNAWRSCSLRSIRRKAPDGRSKPRPIARI